MKIAYLITRSDNIGGAQVHVRDLAYSLRQEGHEAWVLTGGEGPFTRSLASQSTPYVVLRHLRAPITPWRDLRAVAEVRGVLRDLAPDLVSTHSSKAGVVGRLAARSLAIPALFTAHGWSFTPGVPRASAAVYRWLERLAGPLASRIITVSDFDRELAMMEHVAAPENITTIHNGMPDVPFGLLADPAGEPVRLAMVARFEPQKDHVTLLRALAELRALKWSLDLIGEGPLMPAVRSLAADLGLTARVRFWGAVDNVPTLLSLAQVYLLVSNWEGFPRSILEAMRAGLPVVGSKVGGVAEAVEHGVTGFLVPRGDAGEVARAVRLLIQDPGLRQSQGASGRSRFKAHFTLEQTVAKTMGVYRAMITPDTPAGQISQFDQTSPLTGDREG